ncbi:DNA-binding transcriptional activator of the SARP family [Lentzea fradiae]|uniref:DNA-binding transcriptional activator of the SARP family n=1 Tax=Lentzea fradiae TaxID=200378 RepID=A0A1G7YN95_9PSEU|nr:AfsR/SARP family transcriptional regulator [Lentzea fradiae]SDG97907.1 DNA-binding transcriptional activator of the SARP family [Lentzea fradiae]
MRSKTGLEFGVLGPLQVLADGRLVQLGRRGMRALLALLVVEANRPVSIDQIVDALWTDAPPATARTIVHGYVSRLRKVLDEADPARSAVIRTTPTGYQLTVDPWRLDLHRARQLVASSRGKPAAIRAGLLREALGLWRGPVLVDVPGDPLTSDLEELRLSALEERIDAELDLGRHLELVGELRGLCTEHPFRERLVAHSMRALYRSGQRADALDAYQRFQRRAADELGIDPGPELRQLHEQVLRDDPALSVVGPVEARPVAPRAGIVAPALLPASASRLFGRDADKTWLDDVCATRNLLATTVAVLTGPPGIGKSALATTWGHENSEMFQHGVLFASLGDAEPGEVLTRFLVALGVPADGVPVAVEDRVGLYRSLLNRRRVLVVLDDATAFEQVQPLLPPGSGSVVLVTSRSRMERLVVSNSARVRKLGPLDEDAARELVDDVLGKPLSAEDPAASRKLAELCGGLPLALRVAAAKLVISPEWTVEELVGELADDGHRMRGLDLPEAGMGVSRALDLSTRDLPPELGEVFRSVGLAPGRWMSPHAVAALTRTHVESARTRLSQLVEVNLLVEPWPDGFTMHELVRLYVRGAGRSDRDSLRRLVNYYLVACDHVRRAVRPARDGLEFASGDNGTTPVPEVTDPVGWFDQEWPNVVAVVHAAAEAGLHDQVWQLVRLLHTYATVRALTGEWVALVGFGLAAAEVTGSRLGQVLMLDTAYTTNARLGRPVLLPDARRAHRLATELGERQYLVLTLAQLADVLFRLEQHDEALLHLWESVQLAQQSGDVVGEAHGLNNVAQVEQARGRLEVALRHQAQAVDVYRRCGDQAALTAGLANLAELHLEGGSLDQAESLARQVVDQAAAVEMTFLEGFGRQVLGGVLLRRAEWVAASAELTESLRLLSQVNSARAVQVRATLDVLSSEV